MSDIWFKKLGFSRNPFSIKPAAFSYELFGNSSESVLSSIEEGKAVFVEAQLGYGKTTLLKGIIQRYGGKRKVVYAHAIPSEQLDVKGLLKRSSISNYLTGSIPTGMILVVDEAQNIGQDSVAEIAEFYNSGNVRAVVFFGTTYASAAFARTKALNGSLVRLSKPTPEQAVSIIRGRIGNLAILSNEAILAAYKKAQGSPRKLLQLCEDACRAAAEGTAVATASVADAYPEKAKHLAVQKKARKPKAAKAVARAKAVSALEQMRVIEPEAAMPISEVSSTESPLAGEIAVEKKLKPSLKAKAARRRNGLARKKALKPSKVKYSINFKETARNGKKQKAVSPEADSKEGIYWGEFMGMQK